MSTRAEILKVLEQRTNAAKKRASVPVKAKPVAKPKSTGLVKATRRTVKRRAAAHHARVG